MSEHIRLWWTDIAAINEDKIIEKMASLPEVVVMPIKKTKTLNARKQRLFGRLLLAKALGGISNLEALCYTSKGQPFIPEFTAFSITHSYPIVAIAFADSGKSIGIDIEPARPLTSIGAAPLYFHPKELERPRQLLEYWTKKEAFFKLLGGNVNIALRDIAVLGDKVEWDGQFYYFQKINLLEFPQFEMHLCCRNPYSIENIELTYIQAAELLSVKM